MIQCVHLAGAWILAVAKEVGDEPELIGADISTSMFPPADANWVPPNVQFFEASTLSLPREWTNTFDLVNQRFMIAAFTTDQWRTAVSEIFRVLKPGGKAQLVEVISPSSDAVASGRIDKKYCLHRIADTITRAMDKRGQPFDCAHRIPAYLQEAGFIDVSYVDGRGPVGKYGGEQGLRGAYVLRPIVLMYLRVLKQEGVLGENEIDIDRMTEGIVKEWEEDPGMYFELRATVATKPH
jgi:SAM-dependent methyltransferase